MGNNSNFLISTEAVCKILHVCPRTLYNYRTEGKLEYYQFSRKKIMYRIGDVVEFVKKSSYSSIFKDKVNSLLEKYIVHL
ncbi:putative site-specific integrase-resolvase [Dysgonomonas hofstadii]|uniref:Putative site-specific integrase-resolvase n=1 Tax=Dysgonomonas hofstadii TaxID=637886 RepID=A0A840CMB7_9BACT|nr:helix-turn-helix domain-containing protein [Dysgonomonas hofstadii]MBB4034155.1 putative site-specific integrase-resolvase [Dysgonomonas hofstadii]